uniref:uncharacterized protein F13E9.13, mitochondrial isoform X3 n=1 Tax=Pristiophorus japonicus TaxID=55135 RepID=UPI00398EE893
MADSQQRPCAAPFAAAPRRARKAGAAQIQALHICQLHGFVLCSGQPESINYWGSSARVVVVSDNREGLSGSGCVHRCRHHADFIRVEGFVFSHIADEGFLNACAGDLLRYRKKIGAEHIQIFTDIKKKHSSHAVTSDVSVSDTARNAEFFLSDGVILTGIATGEQANPEDLKDVKRAVRIPVLVGSGVTVENMEQYMDADAMIIGSYFKKGGYWANELDSERINKFMTKVHQLRK